MRRAVSVIVMAHATKTNGKDALFAAINQAAAALQRHLPAVIAAGRADARNAALKTLHADADALRKALRAAGEDDTLPELPMPSDSVTTDRRRASSTAIAFADAWKAAAIAHVAALDAADEARVRSVFKAALDKTKFQQDRIVATENAHAFNDERAKAAATSLRGGDVEVWRQWDATLDASTCEICADLDGTTAPLDSPFMLDGQQYEPGGVHPNCRCVFHVATGAVRKAA